MTLSSNKRLSSTTINISINFTISNEFWKFANFDVLNHIVQDEDGIDQLAEAACIVNSAGISLLAQGQYQPNNASTIK